MKKLILSILGLIIITGCTKKDDGFVIIDKTKEVSDFVCAEAIDNFYNDDNYSYYFNCIKSNYIVVRYDNGDEELVSVALKNKKISISDLDKFNINYIKEFNQSYTKVIEDIKIELNIPGNWNYEEIPKDKENDFYKYALKIYKSENNYAVLYFYNDSFGVCGTGRTDKKITLNNGKEATIGYYNGNKNWSDISFYDNKFVAIINYGLTDKDSEELLEIIKTINITNMYD